MNAVAVTPQRFATLLRVEWRKLTDTRSSRVALGVILATCAFAPIWLLIRGQYAVTFHRYTNGAANTAAFLVPIVVVLAMTAEWTQRTALTTFTLSPHRGRVIASKFIAALGLAVAALTVVLLIATGATALGSVVRGDAQWDGVAADLRTYYVIIVLQVIMAAAFGAVAGNTAVGLVIYLAAPTAWAAAADTVLGDAARWFDIFETYNRLSSATPGALMSQTLTSMAVWVVLPAAVGIARSMRREIK